MATKLGKIAFGITQWLLVPATLVALGYYVIGPRLGAPADGVKNAAGPPAEPEATTPAEEAPKTYAEPKVEVSVRRGSNLTTKDLVRPKRKKRKVTPPPSTKPPAPVTDPESPPSVGGDPPETVPLGGGAAG